MDMIITRFGFGSETKTIYTRYDLHAYIFRLNSAHSAESLHYKSLRFKCIVTM